MDSGNPNASALDIRDVFDRMGFNDSETVAIIGGGHAFGKTHGACPLGPGPDPKTDPLNPWVGTCGSGPTQGKANNTFTSGYEGPWTDSPAQWDNDYFNNLLNFKWGLQTGPGGNIQWQTIGPGPTNPNIMMLTSDIALISDPAVSCCLPF